MTDRLPMTNTAFDQILRDSGLDTESAARVFGLHRTSVSRMRRGDYPVPQDIADGIRAIHRIALEVRATNPARPWDHTEPRRWQGGGR